MENQRNTFLKKTELEDEKMDQESFMKEIDLFFTQCKKLM